MYPLRDRNTSFHSKTGTRVQTPSKWLVETPFEVEHIQKALRINNKLSSVLCLARKNFFCKTTAATGPCSVKVSVESESGRPLGETEVDYIDDPSIYPIVLRHLASKYDGSNGHTHGDTSNSPNGESNNGNTQSDSGSSGNSGKLRYWNSLLASYLTLFEFLSLWEKEH